MCVRVFVDTKIHLHRCHSHPMAAMTMSARLSYGCANKSSGFIGPSRVKRRHFNSVVCFWLRFFVCWFWFGWWGSIRWLNVENFEISREICILFCYLYLFLWKVDLYNVSEISWFKMKHCSIWLVLRYKLSSENCT